MPDWTYWYVNLYPPLTVVSLLAAGRWGGPTEVSVAAGYLTATLLQKLGQGIWAPMYSAFEPIVAFVDVALFLWLFILATRDAKAWLICATALQLLACFAHWARMFEPDMPALVYALLMGSGGYPSLILLTIGTAQYRVMKPASPAFSHSRE